MIEVLTIGEPMGLLVAEEVKPLEDVEHFTRYVCGAEVNFSVGMARLGHEIAYISKIGNDPFGKRVKKFLVENKIDNRYVKFDDDHMTGMQLKAKVESGDPEVVNFRKNTAFANLTAKDIENIDWSTVKHMHVTGIPPALSASCREAIYTLMDTAKAHGVQISFDTNLRPALWQDKAEMVRVINDLAFKADIVLPGIGEGKILTGSDDPETVADFYLKQGVKIAVIKVGSKGAFVKTKDEKFMAPAFTVEHVVDTVGAGDGFAVGVVSALLEGKSLQEAAERGAAIGALAIMVAGDNEGLPTKDGLAKFLAAHK